MKNQKEYTLTVEFINKKLVGNKVEQSLSGKRYSYTGDTKKECINKAKSNFRYNSSYHKQWSVELINH